MSTRIMVALQSPDAWRRLVHFVAAKVLYALPDRARRSLFAGRQHHCPVCGTDLARFLVLHRSYHLWCPVCRSLQRHRFLWLYYAEARIFDPQHSQRLLHFAPEPCLTRRFAGIPQLDYVSADLFDPSAMLKMDISQIVFPDNSFDLILCSHVLEHVPDDHRAMRELHRVLKPGGQAIILVPIAAGVTREDPSITSPMRREELFGQFDHVRVYGSDFQDRLRRAGLIGSAVSVHDVAVPDQVRRMGLDDQDMLFLCQKSSNEV